MDRRQQLAGRWHCGASVKLGVIGMDGHLDVGYIFVTGKCAECPSDNASTCKVCVLFGDAAADAGAASSSDNYGGCFQLTLKSSKF